MENVPEGSQSKLSTFRDGFRVLRTLLFLFKDMRPLLFFGAIAAVCALAGLGLGAFVIDEYTRTSQVTHPSTAVLAVALVLSGMVALATGLILDTFNRRAGEIQRLITDQLLSRNSSAR